MTDIQGFVIFVLCHGISKNGFVSHVCTLKCTLFLFFNTVSLDGFANCRTFVTLKTLEWKARLVWNGLDTYEIADTKGNLTRDQWSRSDLVSQAVNRRSWNRKAIYYLSQDGLYMALLFIVQLKNYSTMAYIQKRLSKKVNAGKSQIIFHIGISRTIKFRYKTGINIEPEYWSDKTNDLRIVTKASKFPPAILRKINGQFTIIIVRRRHKM